MYDKTKRRVRFIQMSAFPSDEQNKDVFYALDDHGFMWRGIYDETENRTKWTRIMSPLIEVNATPRMDRT